MKKENNNVTVVLSVICLLLVGFFSGLVGYTAAPEKVVTETELVEVPTVVTETVTETVEVEVADTSLVLDDALSEFLNEVEDKDNWLKCNGHEYDFDEISVSRLYDKYTVELDEDTQVVSFKVKLKYDEDGEKSCKKTFEPVVEYDYDEDEVKVTV